MDQRGFHRVDSYFHLTLTQFLNHLKDRQHGVDLYRVITGHRDKDARF